MKEQWKAVKGYEGIYEVSSLGRVKRLAHWKNQDTTRAYKTYKYKMLDEKILKPCTASRYSCIQLSRDRKITTRLVHRLVAEAFIPNPDNLPEVNHKDCDGHNNSLCNLEWCDRKYNINYADRTAKAAKACEKKVICVETGREYDSVTKAAKATGILKARISAVCRGDRKTTGGFHWSFVKERRPQ